MYGRLPNHLRPACPVKFVACIDRDVDVRRVVTELEKGVSSVVNDNIEALLDAAAHLDQCQVFLGFEDGRRRERVCDEAPHDDADCDLPDLRPLNFVYSDEFGGGNQVADVEREFTNSEFL